jgi:hypothetical protein
MFNMTMTLKWQWRCDCLWSFGVYDNGIKNDVETEIEVEKDSDVHTDNDIKNNNDIVTGIGVHDDNDIKMSVSF